MQSDSWDITIVGGGAAGLATAIFTAKQARERNFPVQILIVDGARKLGAKILVSGGGRCNVTHAHMNEQDFNGAPNIVRRTLKAFDHLAAAQWFESLGVSLKQEPTGKLFPESDSARSVLSALLDECNRLGIRIYTKARVQAVTHQDDQFFLETDAGPLKTKALVLATGGKALPKSGSDGKGFEFAQQAGHSIVSPLPALVPLVLKDNFFHSQLSGISHQTELSIWVNNKRIEKRYGSMLWTHFGISGPVAMDASGTWVRRQYLQEKPQLKINLLGQMTFEETEQWLLQATEKNHAKSIGKLLYERLPKPLINALGEFINQAPTQALGTLSKVARRQWIRSLTELPLPVHEHRGWNHAEVTSGGVPLKEISPKTFESKMQPGLFLVGEILDCDGRIGGFNFQWAWSSGYVAARGILARLSRE